MVIGTHDMHKKNYIPLFFLPYEYVVLITAVASPATADIASTADVRPFS